jgi:YaiO family outer membrane protein
MAPVHLSAPVTIASDLASSPYQSAVAARQMGNSVRAIALLAPWLIRHPNDSDARLQYGLALLDLGRLRDAETAFRLVLLTAPDYDDARIGLARITQRRGDRVGARAQLVGVSLSNKDAALLRRQLDEPDMLRWGLAVDASRTDLSRGQPGWREVDAQASFLAKEGVTLVGRVEASRRFNLDDTYAEGQLVTRLSPSLTTYALAGGTPHAHYRPQWQIGTGGAFTIRSMPDATSITLDLRLADYRSGQIATINSGIQQDWSSGLVRANGQLITIVDQGRASFGLLGRLDARVTGRLQLFAGVARAPDVSEGIVLQTTSVFGGGELRVGSVASLRLSASRTTVRGGSDRTQLSGGFGTRF